MDPTSRSTESPRWLPTRTELGRAVLVLALTAAALLLTSEVLPGFTLDGPGAALGLALVIGAVNALVWPTLVRFTLPLSVLSLGLSALILNGLVIALAAAIAPRTQISGWDVGIAIAVVITVITALLSALLAVGDDDSWRRNVLARQLRRRGAAIETDVPGIVFLEIDGLAHDVLLRAMREGHAPNLARWIADGSHVLRAWETDTSSQTGACQAGLLHGTNEGIPAFRWWEKDAGRAIVTNHPRDAEEIERRVSDGNGLLAADGASRANILSGDATHSMLTMSTVLTRRRPIGRDYAVYFANPYAVARTMVSSIAEYARERRAAADQRRRDVRPRIARSRVYAVMRAWATVIQLDLQVAAVVGDMLAGRPSIYSTFLAYDEVAHHSGIERADALDVLAKVDRELARVDSARAQAPRPYELVVLADHGQSQGATFLQRYGETLEEVVRAATGLTDVHADSGGEDEAMAYASAGMTELRRDDTVAGRMVRTATGSSTEDDVVELGDDAKKRRRFGRRREKGAEGPPELSVMASGCLGLISFPRQPGRLTLEEIDRLHPGLIPALRAHPGIGFVMVRTEAGSAVVLGRDGSRRLEDDTIEGEDPLAPFGPRAADHLRRSDSFEHCPDLLLNSTYWTEQDEVAAFEELVGSHGGLGGTQCVPFVCHPASFEWPDEYVVGAGSVHAVFKTWLAKLGHSPPASVGGGAGGDETPA